MASTALKTMFDSLVSKPYVLFFGIFLVGLYRVHIGKILG